MSPIFLLCCKTIIRSAINKTEHSHPHNFLYCFHPLTPNDNSAFSKHFGEVFRESLTVFNVNENDGVFFNENGLVQRAPQRRLEYPINEHKETQIISMLLQNKNNHLNSKLRMPSQIADDINRGKMSLTITTSLLKVSGWFSIC